jgi:cell division protein FtsB
VSPGALRVTVIGVAVTGILAYGGSAGVRVWQMRSEVDALERELAALRAETDRLTVAIDRLRTDPEYVEQLARERLGLVKPGERVLKLPSSR